MQNLVIDLLNENLRRLDYAERLAMLAFYRQCANDPNYRQSQAYRAVWREWAVVSQFEFNGQ